MHTMIGLHCSASSGRGLTWGVGPFLLATTGALGYR